MVGHMIQRINASRNSDIPINQSSRSISNHYSWILWQFCDMLPPHFAVPSFSNNTHLKLAPRPMQ